MYYNAKYFRNSLPLWKRKKDPILSKVFYRPVSFYFSSVATYFGISANAVSYFSAFIGILSCILFLFNNYVIKIIGAVLINIWLILDCTDGNIARSVKRQPFGEFADGISSYLLVGLMGITMGFSVYFSGGIWFKKGNPYIILLGSLASISDTMMRLFYQKYKDSEKDMQENGIIESCNDISVSSDKVGYLRVRIEAELGIGGILPISILIATIFESVDVIILYCLIYFGLSFIITSYMLISNTIIQCKKIIQNNNRIK